MLLMNKMIQKVELKRMEKMEIKKKNKKILLITQLIDKKNLEKKISKSQTYSNSFQIKKIKRENRLTLKMKTKIKY